MNGIPNAIFDPPTRPDRSGPPPGEADAPRQMKRREFLGWGSKAALGALLGLGGSSLAWALGCGCRRVTVRIPNLPEPFIGRTIAFLSDVHHGHWVPLSYVRKIVEMTNALRPD